MRFRCAAAAMFMTILALPGCVKPEEKAGEPGAAAAGARPTTPDDKIAAAVKEKFAADPDLKKESIQVAVKDGRVTLTGTTSSDAAKIKAEDAARAVNDVFGVDAEKLVAR